MADDALEEISAAPFTMQLFLHFIALGAEPHHLYESTDVSGTKQQHATEKRTERFAVLNSRRIHHEFEYLRLLGQFAPAVEDIGIASPA